MKIRKSFLILVLLAILSILPALSPIDRSGELQTIVIMGDSRTNIEMYRAITEQVVLHHPKAVFHTGDMVSNGLKQDQWAEFHDATKKIRDIASFYPACGNHEMGVEPFLKQFPELGKVSWYSVNQAGLHWIILNSQQSLKQGSKQYKWLDKDLKSNKTAFNVIIMHHPIYSSGGHAHELDSKDLRGLIEKYRVRLVFSGHDHLYERSFHEGTNYIVTGGAGAPLKGKVYENPYSQFFSSTYHYCVLYNYPTQIDIDVYDIDKNKIDSISIEKKER